MSSCSLRDYSCICAFVCICMCAIVRERGGGQALTREIPSVSTSVSPCIPDVFQTMLHLITVCCNSQHGL